MSGLAGCGGVRREQKLTMQRRRGEIGTSSPTKPNSVARGRSSDQPVDSERYFNLIHSIGRRLSTSTSLLHRAGLPWLISVYGVYSPALERFDGGKVAALAGFSPF